MSITTIFRAANDTLGEINGRMPYEVRVCDPCGRERLLWVNADDERQAGYLARARATAGDPDEATLLSVAPRASHSRADQLAPAVAGLFLAATLCCLALLTTQIAQDVVALVRP
jgi:hypothetical protein